MPEVMAGGGNDIIILSIKGPQVIGAFDIQQIEIEVFTLNRV
jgi:hypothetical protein